ncbi:MAG: peptidase and in kexin sedolisin [Thermoleophilia bacterium]|nr:peptidase and in kexin sedolisin [Thermoleophilia bacterium]
MSLTATSARSRARSLFLGGAVALALVAAPAASATPVVVDVADGTNPATIAAKYGVVPDQVFTEVANAFSADVTAKQLAKLDADGSVQEVNPDGVVAHIDRPTFQLARGARFRPGTKPYLPPAQFEQYVAPEIRRIGANLSPTADIDGIDDRRVDADIAIVDSGVDPFNPDLNVVGGFDCVKGPRSDRGWGDRGDGHGTATASLAAAIDNGIGTVGAAPGARIWSVRVADPFGNITDSALLCGLEYVSHNRSIEVANLSLAGTGNQTGPCLDPRRWWRGSYGRRSGIDKIHQRICRLTNRGITVVAAAGNDAADASAYTPASYDEVIAVSAFADFDGLPGGLSPTYPECPPTEADDRFATFSNFGRVIDVSAPGVCSFTAGPGGQYGYVDGTSFAAPLVSGGAALLLSRRHNLSPERVRAQIRESAKPGPIAGDTDGFAEGILDVSTF